MTPAPGKRFPDLSVILLDGSTLRISDYSQRDNVVLVVDPENQKPWATLFSQQAKLWEWLHVRPFATKEGSPGLPAGIYLIDRLGGLIEVLPLDPWDPSKVESAYVYHEARHC